MELNGLHNLLWTSVNRHSWNMVADTFIAGKFGRETLTLVGNCGVCGTDNSLEFGKACEELSWNHCTSTPHRSEANGLAERAVRRIQEETSVLLLQWDEKKVG